MIATTHDLIDWLQRDGTLIELNNNRPMGFSINYILIDLATVISCDNLDKLGKLLGLVRYEVVGTVGGVYFVEKDSAFMKRIIDYLNEHTFCYTSCTFISQLKSCRHNWANYIGFTQSFEFCTLCDVKK